MPGLFPNVKIEAAVEKFVLRRANLVLAQNTENMSYPKSLGINPSRLVLTPLGIGIDKCHFVQNLDRPSIERELLELGVSPEDLVILCVSRLEKLKMVDHAIFACKYAKLAGLQFKLVIVGDGRERSNLELMARKLGIRDSILFVGNKDQKWISSIAARANLNIAPLCGRSLLEVSLAGCPALAYDVDWHSEIVISGVTGELVKNLDSRAFGNTMIQILSSPSKLQFYSREMKIKASEIASPEKIAQNQRHIYSTLSGF
jgi:glycosyltransferase involved in cell wall biosynthesis